MRQVERPRQAYFNQIEVVSPVTSYRNKHRVLKALDDLRCEVQMHGNYSVQDIAQKANLSVEQTHKALASLGATQPNEVEYKTGFEQFRYRVTEFGTLAVHSQKYLSEGKEKRKAEWLRGAQILGIVGSLLISTTTLLWTLLKSPASVPLPLTQSRPVGPLPVKLTPVQSSETQVPATRTSRTKSVSVIGTSL